MAKYISYYPGSNREYLLMADEDCKNYWFRRDERLLFLPINDADYELAKWKTIKIENGAWEFHDFADSDGNVITEKEITENDFYNRVNEHKKRAKLFFRGCLDAPSHYANGLTSILNFNPGGITFPVTAKNWIKVCIDNNIEVPFIKELI